MSEPMSSSGADLHVVEPILQMRGFPTNNPSTIQGDAARLSMQPPTCSSPAKSLSPVVNYHPCSQMPPPQLSPRISPSGTPEAALLPSETHRVEPPREPIEHQFTLAGWNLRVLAPPIDQLGVCAAALQSQLPGDDKQLWEGIWETKEECIDQICTGLNVKHLETPSRHVKWLLERKTGMPHVEVMHCQSQPTAANKSRAQGHASSRPRKVSSAV
eukprot:TRINITY_DN1367_c0_g1_i4.p1 TRINITY_DN1367_c0_g1~~TRINITY_DN1367_c0_g1_i4.p1  ORF type:complete len:215 (-),score=22.45 TRINITY_DN1367_c0_g1_i4:414-1058(-)